MSFLSQLLHDGLVGDDHRLGHEGGEEQHFPGFGNAGEKEKEKKENRPATLHG